MIDLHFDAGVVLLRLFYRWRHIGSGKRANANKESDVRLNRRFINVYDHG
jgi:hypothetical protein